MSSSITRNQKPGILELLGTMALSENKRDRDFAGKCLIGAGIFIVLFGVAATTRA